MQANSSQLTLAAERADRLQADNLALQQLTNDLQSQLDKFGVATSAALTEQDKV